MNAWEVVRTDAGVHVRLRAANGEIVLTSRRDGDALDHTDAGLTRAVQVALSTSAMRTVDQRVGEKVPPLPYSVWEFVTTSAGVHLRLRAPDEAGLFTTVLTSETYRDRRPAARAVEIAMATLALRSVDERTGAK